MDDDAIILNESFNDEEFSVSVEVEDDVDLEAKLLLSANWKEELAKYRRCLLERREIKYRKSCVYGTILGSVPVTQSDMVDATFESLDYDLGSSVLRRRHDETVHSPHSILTTLLRWFLLLITGILPALVAIGINSGITLISNLKFRFLREFLDQYYTRGSMVIPFTVWIVLNWIFGAIAGTLVTFIEPQAAGSGIPQIKAYLNGVSVPRLMRLKTLFVKTFGVVFSVLAGMAVGKEGPMIHSGAAIGAGVCQGKSSSLGWDFIVNSRLYRAFTHYRNDAEKRDFVACGAAAGVAAAFGAPFGGVLFALEEGNSHYDPYLMWKLTFTATTSYFTLNLINSFIKGFPGQLSSGGLISFGKFEDASYGLETFPVLFLFGVIGGLLGALYVFLNEWYTKIRLRYFQNRCIKVLDVVYIAGLGAALGGTMFLIWDDCVDLPVKRPAHSHPVQLNCPGGQYHVLANLWFATPEEVVKSLLHEPSDHFPVNTLFVFGLCYFLLAFITYGLSISSGVFVPSILIGCTWGRALGMLLMRYVTFIDWGNDIGKFALFGAAAQLSGNVRMMVSLTLIIIESTGNLTYSFPLVFVCMVAKYTGDFFNNGLYETHTDLAGVPYLAWHPPAGSKLLTARQIMTSPLHCFQMTNSLEYVWNLITLTNHNGFPVVDPPAEEEDVPGSNTQKTFGKLRGIVLRDQIMTMLHYGLFSEVTASNEESLSWETLRSLYPRFPSKHKMTFTTHELKSLSLDFRNVMNHSPFTVNANAPVDNVYRLFRLVGLRHLIVVNDSGETLGIITRQNLARIHPGGFKDIFIPQNERDLKDVGPHIQIKFKTD